eukprot:EG_transcript_18192
MPFNIDVQRAPSLASAMTVISSEPTYCHNPYAPAVAVHGRHTSPTAEEASDYCHNPYTLPRFMGQTWEETWSAFLRDAEPTRPPSRPALNAPSGPPSPDSFAGPPFPRRDALPAAQYDAAASAADSPPRSRRSSAASGTATSEDSSSSGGPARDSGSLPRSRFPVSLEGRCRHRTRWLRLRGKRGCTYYMCTLCTLSWRKPHTAEVPAQQESTAEPINKPPQ